MIEMLKKELHEADEATDRKKMLQRLKLFQGFKKAGLKSGIYVADHHSGHPAGSASDGGVGWGTFCDF